MSQGLGSASIMINEGLSAFHNPAIIGSTQINFTLSRWLSSTNHFSLGATYKDNVIGISYLNYGGIQGYDQFGVPTNEFTPYDICVIFGRRIGLFGLSIKTFGEKVDTQSLYGVCLAISSYIDFGNIAIGAKIDNLGKEFGENTTIPFTSALGLKLALPRDITFFIESKMPHLEINSGLLYKYHYVKLLVGTRYIKPEDLISETYQGFHISDLNLSGGIIVLVESYEIGYSFVYTEFSNAHQFSITFTPYP